MDTQSETAEINPWVKPSFANELEPKLKKKKVVRYFDGNQEDVKYDPKEEYPIVEEKKEFSIIKPNLKSSRKWKQVLRKEENKYTGRPPLSQDVLDRHSRGEGINYKDIQTRFHTSKLQRQDAAFKQTVQQAARSELLLTEDGGYLEADEGECTRQFTQKQIASAVDIATCSKHFDLHLAQFGPYRMDYNRSGRYLLLGGKRGHVAAIDWHTKKLFCEMNVMEQVLDVKWLHVETMFAVAQKSWVYIYDNQGIELHCLKQLNNVLRMEFLPHHFLLCTSSELGYLSWLDISIGKIVSQFNTRQGQLNVLTQNPGNATICLGHSKGTVTMWSPNVREPLAQLLAHKHGVQAISINSKGQYMATASGDRTFKIWDLRMLQGHLQEYRLQSSASKLAFSQRGLLAVGMGGIIEVFQDVVTQANDKCYLRHKMTRNVENFQFCPYEDVLGVGHSNGFTSLIIPGAGEANFDALESNPFQSKSQRREAEVKALLEKVQPEFIGLENMAISQVNLPSVQEKVEAQIKSMHFTPPKFKLEHRKGKKLSKTKKILQEEAKRDFVKNIKRVPKKLKTVESTKPSSVLDRFKSKK